MGETSRSLHERATEHQNDAKSFSQKSHQVKHWMISHPEEPIQPPFSIKILKRYRDCLSRQIGEALQIFYSNDHLLNSKSEYVQNCISRIAVSEETWERKERERREEEEEKQEKENLERFKVRKRMEDGQQPVVSQPDQTPIPSQQEDQHVSVSLNTSLQEEHNHDFDVLGGWRDGWLKKTKDFRSEGRDGNCVSKRLRMSSLQEEEWDVQDLRLPILPKVTVEAQPEEVERAHNSDTEIVVEISGQQEECTNVEVYAHNDVLPINKESHIQGDVNLLPGVVKGPSPQGPTGSVHETAEVCSTNVEARGARHPIKKPNSRVPKLGDLPSGRKSSSSPTMTLAWLSTWWKRMEKERQTDKEVYGNKNAKKIFMEYFSAEYIGHAVDTLRVTETHKRTAIDVAIGSHPYSDGGREGVASDDVTIGHHPTVARCTGQGSPFGGRGKKRLEHGGSDSPAKRRNKFKSLLDFWRGDQSDVDTLNPDILGKMAENFTSKIEHSDLNNCEVDNCTKETNSLLSDGFGERGK